MEGLGNKIKEIRGSLTQREFAAKLGVDKSTLASWEIDRREPDLETLVQLADFGNVSLDWLANRCSNDKPYLHPTWREIIQLAKSNGITPKLAKQLFMLIITIKKT